MEPDRGLDDRFVSLLGQAHHILFFTGAGISTGSGIPDFRGPQGVWKTRQPVYYQDFMSSENARIQHWEFKLEGWEQFRDARPTPVHEAIVRLERAGKVLMVVTQNVDGLHSRAGTESTRLVEIHGTNTEVECQSCLERSDPGPHHQHFRETRMPPRCHCGGFLKAATISFGQNLLEADLARAASAARETDLVVALGSTLSVYPAASLPLTAVDRGVPYIVVNRGVTDHDHHPGLTLRLEGDVQDLFPLAAMASIGQRSRAMPPSAPTDVDGG